MDGTELVSSLFPVQICTNEIMFGKGVHPWDSFESSKVEFYSDSRAGDVRFRSIDFRLRPAGVPQGGWCHKGCQNIAILMRISDMYSNLP